MRHISFALTTSQLLARTKTVTRRIGWRTLPPAGTQLQAVRKSQGLKKGEHVERLHVIVVVDARRERLGRMLENREYGLREVVLEGFPELTPEAFVTMFCAHNKCTPHTFVTRIEFDYPQEAGA